MDFSTETQPGNPLLALREDSEMCHTFMLQDPNKHCYEIRDIGEQKPGGDREGDHHFRYEHFDFKCISVKVSEQNTSKRDRNNLDKNP